MGSIMDVAGLGLGSKPALNPSPTCPKPPASPIIFLRYEGKCSRTVVPEDIINNVINFVDRPYGTHLPMRDLGFPCIHPGHIHDRIIETFTVFDPLCLKPANRTVALAVMFGVVILSLGDSVTKNGILC